MHRVKIGDKIRVLRDDPVGTDEKSGTVLQVLELLSEDRYHTDGNFLTSASFPLAGNWEFGNQEIEMGLIEIVQPDFIEENVARMQELALVSEVSLSTFQRDRIKYMKRSAESHGWIQLSKADVEMFNKILGDNNG